MDKKQSFFCVLTLLTLSSPTFAADLKKNDLDLSYDHNYWGAKSSGIEKKFTAYTSSFDSADDNNADGTSDVWGQPRWVSTKEKERRENVLKRTQGHRRGSQMLSFFRKVLCPKMQAMPIQRHF